MREASELKLMQLKQGFMTVAEYTSKFKKLCKFSRICQGAPESSESWKCIKYQGGLKDGSMTPMAPLEIRRIFELVNKARVVEECAKKTALARDSRGCTSIQDRGKYFPQRGQNFKKGGHASQRSQGNLKGTNCDQYPLAKGRGVCYSCGLPGHIANNCPRSRKQNADRFQQQG
ncbi:uncharacterized protein LOC107474094 [Arachis duranensis]|uniref:Uncharacterized protein LOC107474094 n=1 Tax=Arachis duranensis TaxID=130453 RepID=A0A6P4CDA6_ARADU|nr:uncharacterized protein LOC107474094 [Arachis duranensis]